jgi:hypothetical protein
MQRVRAFVGRHKVLSLLVGVLLVLGLIGGSGHKHPQSAAAASPPVADAGYRTISADGVQLACADVLPAGADKTGLAALTINPSGATRGQVFVWQFASGEATFTPGVSWALVVYWLNGSTVVGSTVSRPASGPISSPASATAAAAVPVSLVPYRLPVRMVVGATCAPAA